MGSLRLSCDLLRQAFVPVNWRGGAPLNVSVAVAQAWEGGADGAWRSSGPHGRGHAQLSHVPLPMDIPGA